MASFRTWIFCEKIIKSHKNCKNCKNHKIPRKYHTHQNSQKFINITKFTEITRITKITNIHNICWRHLVFKTVMKQIKIEHTLLWINNIWFSIPALAAKLLPQVSHTKGLCFSWTIRLWAFNVLGAAVLYPHNSQT